MPQSRTNRHDHQWRQDVVSDVFGQKLANEDLEEAFRICNEDFDQDCDFTASAFCQRLTKTRPDIELGKQTRLLLLHSVRQHDTKPEAERERHASRPSSLVPEVQPVSSGSLKQGIPERRRHVRKLTNLVGVYWHTLDKEQNGAMVVENLSLGGCNLRILTPHDLKRGETLRLEFKLDNASESFIRIHGQLRWVLYDHVGIEFQSRHGMPQILADYIAS